MGPNTLIGRTQRTVKNCVFVFPSLSTIVYHTFALRIVVGLVSRSVFKTCSRLLSKIPIHYTTCGITSSPAATHVLVEFMRRNVIQVGRSCVAQIICIICVNLSFSLARHENHVLAHLKGKAGNRQFGLSKQNHFRETAAHISFPISFARLSASRRLQ